MFNKHERLKTLSSILKSLLFYYSWIFLQFLFSLSLETSEACRFSRFKKAFRKIKLSHILAKISVCVFLLDSYRAGLANLWQACHFGTRQNTFGKALLLAINQSENTENRK